MRSRGRNDISAATASRSALLIRCLEAEEADDFRLDALDRDALDLEDVLGIVT